MDDAIEKIARALMTMDCGDDADKPPLGQYECETSELIEALNAAGFAIVPREPTEAMLHAGAMLDDPDILQVFRAMLSAGEVRHET